MKIKAEQEKTRELVAKLDAEDKARNAKIKVGEADWDCRIVKEYEGTKLSRGVRPLCMPGFCCGGSKSADGVVTETCQK